MATPWRGFTAENIFSPESGYDAERREWNLLPLAQQTGLDRDALAEQRDAFLRPYEQQYRDLRAGQGARTDLTSANVLGDPEFQAFVQRGTPPANQTPTQQWTTSAPPTPFAGSGGDLLSLLMGRAQPPTVDRTDPQVRAQADAYRANVDRASRDYLSDVAERLGPLANLQGERRMAAERAGQAAGSFEADLMARELAARRDEAGQARSLWGGLYSGDQGLNLSRELGYLANAQTSANRAQQMDQFLRELALRQYDLGNEWDYRWLGLGG